MTTTSPYKAEKLLESFFRISTLITTPLSFDDMLRRILDEVIDTMGFHRGIIYLFDEEKENLTTKVVKNYSPEEAKRAYSFQLSLKNDDCLETKVIANSHYIVLEEFETDPRLTDTDRRISGFHQRGSTFFAPLQIENNIAGLISLWYRDKTTFSPETINILLTFANQISVVIHTAALFEDNRNKIKKLLILEEAVSNLNASYDLDKMHEITINSSLKISDAEKALLFFIDMENNRFLISDGAKIFNNEENPYYQRIRESIIQKALEGNAAVVQNRHQNHGMPPVFDGYLSEIAIPLRIKDKFRGALYLSRKSGTLSSDQKNLLDILIMNAATSYDGAIMHSLLSREAKSLKSEIERLKEREYKLMGFHNIIGNSSSMHAIFQVIKEVSEHDTSILITGESGTGKELIARAIHRQSNRRSKRFVDINCAAIPGTLLESELFGYEAGAFTDARKRKIGLLEYANGGTLLLDEIGDMSLPLQAKFLRMLEDGYIRRLGGTENVPIDVKFIFSTNKDLGRMVASGAFREDLYYRISVVPIHIPPLRERGEDLLILAYHYLEEFNKKFNKKVKGFSTRSEGILQSYLWPGNVRELKNIIERVMIMQSVQTVINPENLPADIKTSSPELPLQIAEPLTLDSKRPIDFKNVVETLSVRIKEQIITKALTLHGGNKTTAARFLGISRYALIRELKKIESLKYIKD